MAIKNCVRGVCDLAGEFPGFALGLKARGVKTRRDSAAIQDEKPNSESYHGPPRLGSGYAGGRCADGWRLRLVIKSTPALE